MGDANMRRTGNAITSTCLWLAFLQICHQAHCFEAGAPVSTCTFLYPKHGTAPQTSTSPFTFTPNATSYAPGDVIEISITSSTGVKMTGIQVHTRRQSGDTEELLGSFINVPSFLKTFSWYPHTTGEQNCLTHSEKLEITDITLYWKAPSFSAGDLVIYASFVVDYRTFWVMKNSIEMTAEQPSTNPVFLSEATVGYKTIDTSSCGVSRGCFYYPRDCSGTDCRFIITYVIDEPNMTADIEMFGDAEGYVSIGFSDDKLMTDDHVYLCVQSGSVSRVQHAHNPDYYTDRDRIIDVTNITVGRDDNNIYCKFTRPLVQQLRIYGVPFTFDMRDMMYLMVAWGSTGIGSDGIPSHHHELPVVSDEKIDFTRPVIHTGRSLNIPLVIHASFGIISRMCLAGMAIIIARHFRFPLRKRLLGRALWEQLHIGLNIVTVVLMAVAVIIMFSVLKAWSEYATVHAILGLIVTGLMIILIASGFLAPKRSSKWRVYFNWGHRITGVLVFFVSVVCCILGFDVSLIEHQLRSRELIILIVWMFFHIIWDIIFEILSCSREQQKAKEKAARKAEKEGAGKSGMTVANGPPEEKKRKRSYRVEYIFLAIYIAINVLFTFLSMFYLCTT